PFKWYKQNTHEGGVHVPLIAVWPRRITDAGGLRHQFHYVTDVAPTVYECVGVEPPEVHRGLEQIPMAGTSLRYTFDYPGAPDARTVQYFEMMGHRALYLEGWKAVTRHVPGVPFDEDDWELYHVAYDRSECRNLAAERPDMVARMVERWWQEAERFGVLPLDDRTIELFGARYRDHSPHRPDRHYRYVPPMAPMPAQVAPALGGRGWDLAADIDRPAGAGGVLYATGTRNSGVSVFVADDRLHLDYNCFGDHHVVASDRPVPAGPSRVGVRFRRQGRGARAELLVDGAPAGEMEVPFAMTLISSVGPSVGYDHGSPVSDRYSGPFPFEGTLHQLEVDVLGASEAERQDGLAADERAAMARQ
ncbi:MAG TPA: arylsulfatase, partial [Acidimicrobiales bacterium]|nr:arylsulfatase [Acidimicrobiales bacterium]